MADARRKTEDGKRKTSLTHVDAAGRIRMVDVGGKPATAREAIARGRIAISAAAMKQIRDGGMKKGDPLETARLAGIMAAKQTSALIPLCHPLPLSHADVRLTAVKGGYEIEAVARTTASTGGGINTNDPEGLVDFFEAFLNCLFFAKQCFAAC